MYGLVFSRTKKMGYLATMSLLPAHLKPHPSSCSSSYSSTFDPKKSSLIVFRRRPRHVHRKRSHVTVARLFGPAIFEASKLKVLFLGVDGEKHPEKIPRAYTLTHSDITSKLTLAVSQTINRAQLQGWYNKLQRDEVVAEWNKVQGNMSLHVHCHISGGHFLLDLIAGLRYYIFRKELPVVLEAFVHGDGSLFSTYPDLEEAMVWVYFHSNLPEFNRVECWGPLRDAASPERRGDEASVEAAAGEIEWPRRCPQKCDCCFPPYSLIPWPQRHDMRDEHRQEAAVQTQR